MSDFLYHLGTEVLVDMFSDAWRTDTTEVEGQRTYAVHTLRTSLEQMGMSRNYVGACCTQACIIVQNETRGDA
jgi:hypothetical protein